MSLLVMTIISNMLLLGFFFFLGWLFRDKKFVFYMMIILSGVLLTSSTLLIVDTSTGIVYEIIQPLSFLLMISVGFATFIYAVLFLYYTIVFLLMSVLDVKNILFKNKRGKKIR